MHLNALGKLPLSTAIINSTVHGITGLQSMFDIFHRLFHPVSNSVVILVWYSEQSISLIILPFLFSDVLCSILIRLHEVSIFYLS